MLSEYGRRRWWESEYPKIAGKLSGATGLALARAYLYERLTKPLETVTDAEFLATEEIGKKRLAEIRQVVPR